MSALPLEMLVRRVAQHDVEAFSEVYDELSASVFQAALRVTQDHGLAEDVAQEVFAWLWREAAQFDGSQGSVRAWVHMVARRRAIDCVRREDTWRRRGQVEAPGPHDHVIDAVLAAQSHEHLRQVMTVLTARQQEAITLAYFGDRSYGQVADQLDVSLTALKARIRAGLARMRHQLLVDGDGPAGGSARGY
jgi:RNA polymerase sigma-70 factor (ECF subfamily)